MASTRKLTSAIGRISKLVEIFGRRQEPLSKAVLITINRNRSSSMIQSHRPAFNYIGSHKHALCSMTLRRQSQANSPADYVKAIEENDHEEELYQHWHCRFWMSIAALLLGGTIWRSKDFFTVEAAKPFKEADVNANERGSDQIKISDSAKKLKSNRDRFNFIADVVDAAVNAVVCIEVKDHSHIDFFTGVPQTASNGSGFIIKDDGLILTNAHVVPSRPKSSFTVRLTDGRTFSAVIEDIDYESDLATIRINAKNLPTLPLGCSADSKIGEWVVAVGAPLTLSNTVTAGIISSVNRGASELGIRNDINYIQTDAAITFGNSGGPLINLDGEAIGINSMKVTAGISFAIPVDHAKKFLAQAEARKSSGAVHPERRYMGISILTVTDQIRHELESRGGYGKIAHGVLVWQVVVGSPAYRAGIQPGDIIVRINNKEIRTSADLYEVARTADKLQIHVQRYDKLYACAVIPELIPDE